MEEAPFSLIFKFIIIGDPHIGKSSILQSYTEDTFNPEMISTIGIEYGSKVLDLEVEHGKKTYQDRVKVQIWDTAGQERFSEVTSVYYRGSVGVFLVYDITSRASFNSIEKWYNRFLDKNQDHNKTKFTIIGNKSDRGESRQVLYSQGKKLADRMNAGFYETSCKTGENIDLAIKNTAERVYKMWIEAKGENVAGIRKSDLYQFSLAQIRKRRCC